MDLQLKNAIVLGIALLYTIIISIFTLMQKINTSIFYQGTIDNKAAWFLRRNTLWIIIMVAIIIILNIYIKKSGEKLNILIAKNPMIGLVVGVLVVLEGISDLANFLPVNIISIESVFEAISRIDVFLDGTKERMILHTLINNALSIVIILVQIILGFFLIKIYKRKIIKLM